MQSLTYFVSPRSLLPKTSDELVYYIPKEIQLVFYLFRSTLKCACTINETARFQQPLKLSCSLTEIKSTVEIES